MRKDPDNSDNYDDFDDDGVYVLIGLEEKVISLAGQSKGHSA